MKSTGPVVAAATVYGPAGRRRTLAVVVERCPHCAAMHLHRAEHFEALVDALRTGSCGGAYRLQIADQQMRGAA